MPVPIVNDAAISNINLEKSHKIYIQLLRGVTSARLPIEDFEFAKKQVLRLWVDDFSYE